MAKKILFIEDDNQISDEIIDFLEAGGLNVELVSNGVEALGKLETVPMSYACIILDIKMPVMDGIALLTILKERHITIPPVIILSGYLDEDTNKQCTKLGTAFNIKKNVPTEEIEKIVKVFTGTFDENKESIDADVKEQEQLLLNYFNESMNQNDFNIQYDEPLLVIGRRWNSWYPSFFDVSGGAYAIVCPKNTSNGRPSAVIDPGFKFLNIFKKLGISLPDISSCVISHDHPDHIGGIYEFITLRHVLNKNTDLFCNTSTSEMLEKCDIFGIRNKKIDETSVYDLLKWKDQSNREQIVRLRGFTTLHDEMGRHNSSLALSITSNNEIVILGDTQYIRQDHMNKFIPKLVNHKIKTVVLHLGSSQLKIKTGGHLYLTGLKAILQDMDAELDRIAYPDKLLVVVSEWGLEHATWKQVKSFCNHKTTFEDENKSPIIRTIRLLGRDLTKITLIPADIGLMVGINSGDIYFEKGDRRRPDKVGFNIGTTDQHDGIGIRYYPL